MGEIISMDDYLTKLRWKSNYGDFKDITSFQTDCVLYKFDRPLTHEEWNDFLSFIGDAKHLNSLNIFDFYCYFQENKIPCTFKYKFLAEAGIVKNIQYMYNVWNTKKIIEDTEKMMREILDEIAVAYGKEEDDE
jgi:hypothetical protein